MTTDIRSKPSASTTKASQLYLFCGKHLLAAKLRPANAVFGRGIPEELQRVISLTALSGKKNTDSGSGR